ncbi:BRO1-like domain-containing protein [Kalaharituber pfeilii]|nr:BRO1-like domain-containing protein [Kalaharituber pfeilii]
MAAADAFEIPFRRSTPLSLSSAIKTYISSKYDQHPDMFKNDLERIDRLRTDAINVTEPHVSGLAKLGTYAAQLRWIMGKFPIDIGAEFTWYMALGYNTQRPVTQNNLQFEWANVLYNLASLYSKLASSSSHTTTEGLKISCNYFACAAGVLKYLREQVVPELRSSPPEDMDIMTLESLEQLMLAQSQECFWQKAVLDGNRDVIIARLAEQVSEFYKRAEEAGTKSNAISAEWIHRISAKRYHLAGAAQYRAACDCLERSKYGEEIARLEAALQNVNNAVAEYRYLSKLYLSELKGFQAKLTENIKRANKDNDMIYLASVPPASALAPIQKATMAKTTVPKEITEATTNLTPTGPYGAPLFAKLVPFAVHLAASIYAEKKDRLNNKLIEDLEALTVKLHDLLQSLNLPGSLQALEKPLGLPSGLLAHAEEVRQQDGLKRLLVTVEDISKLKANNKAMYQEAAEMLASEEANDKQLREKHGTVWWTRPSSRVAAPQLFKELEDYAEYMKSADQSDKLVKEKVAEHEAVLKVLGGDISGVEAFVPNTQRVKMTPKLEREVSRLRECLNEVSRLESRRRRKIGALREKARMDDITTDLLAETARIERESPMTKIEPYHFDTLFDNRLSTRYSPERNSITEEASEQTQLSTRLREANAAFIAVRKLDSSIKERETALQTLENGYFKYREIVQNLDTGRKFYNDLSKLVGRWTGEVKAWVYERTVEAKRVEEDLAGRMGVKRISEKSGDGIGGSNGPGTPKAAGRGAGATLLSPSPVPVPKPATSIQEPPSPPQTWQKQLRPQHTNPSVTSPQASTSPPAPPPKQRQPQSPQTAYPSSPPLPPKPQPQPQPQSQQPRSPPKQSRARADAPNTPLPAPVPTRAIPPPQIPTPGLWVGDGMTPIRFAGEPPEASRRGSKK